MTPEERILIERNELFRDIDLENVDYILDDCPVLTVFNGEKLLDIGKENNSLYLVLDGELHVYLDSRDLTEHAVLGAGQCVGELSFIDGRNASALVIAARDTRVLVVPHDRVWSLVDNSNGIARNMLCILAGRIRNDNLLRVTTGERSLVFEVAANVDGLTGLHNRIWMDEVFPRMMMRSELGKAPLCLLLADIDHFKSFNHAHGRSAGDAILKGLAKMLAEKMRPQDFLAYLGGDKFAVLLPDTPVDGAVNVAERMRELMVTSVLHYAAQKNVSRTAKTHPLNQDARVTTSFGIAAMQKGDTLDSIFSRAHMALYQAKAAGKDQVKAISVAVPEQSTE